MLSSRLLAPEGRIPLAISACDANKDFPFLKDDFEARSIDELSLHKGERIELIERDDDFGDGWYLGKHMQNGNTGLFPEGLVFICGAINVID